MNCCKICVMHLRFVYDFWHCINLFVCACVYAYSVCRLLSFHIWFTPVIFVSDTESWHSDGRWQESESSHWCWTDWRWIHHGKSSVTAAFSFIPSSDIFTVCTCICLCFWTFFTGSPKQNRQKLGKSLLWYFSSTCNLNVVQFCLNFTLPSVLV